MPVKLLTSGGGGVNLQGATSIASDVTVNIPSVAGTLVNTGSTAQVTQAMLSTNVAGNGPAFSAYQSSAQGAYTAATWTKIAFQTKEFDTNSNFDNTTNYRFTPTIAGYYQINGSFAVNGTSGGVASAIYKNGSQYKQGNYVNVSAISEQSVVSSLVYLNGTTDYVELWGYTATSLAPFANSVITYFNGSMTRSA